MNLSEEIRKQIEKNKGLKLAVGEINNHLSTLEGLARKDIEERVDDAYQRGLEDGKAVNDKGCEGCKYADKVVTGPPCISCCNSYRNQWTAKDDKIEVGDEVRRKSASTNESSGIVTKDWENSYFIMWTDGSSGQWDKDRVIKTGRHFDIASILEAMKHD